MAVQASDLLSIRLTLSSGRVDLFAHIVEGMRFRSLPLLLPEALHPALQSAEGINFTQVPIAALPLASTPADLYALGVAGVRMLLANDENTLAIALDEIFSLAQSLPPAAGEGGPGLGERVKAAAEQEPRWKASLGPHHLLTTPAPAAEGFTHLPAELWWETVALLLQCFPGSVPEAVCADLADAPPEALSAIFEPPIAQLEKLVRRARGLLFGGRAAEAEIQALLRQALEEEFEGTHATKA